MSAREEILRRVRTALADRPAAPPLVRDYRGERGAGDVELFAARLADYGATVHRCADPAATLRALLADHDVVVPDGFPAQLLGGLRVVRDPGDTAPLDTATSDTATSETAPLDTATLDGGVVALTTCRVAIAETATIVLDAGPGMGRRALTLVPDRHVVLVREDQVMAGVPDAVAALEATRPLTWISGPSATSDIELNRVEGVHGPRRLDVVLVDAAP